MFVSCRQDVKVTVYGRDATELFSHIRGFGCFGGCGRFWRWVCCGRRVDGLFHARGGAFSGCFLAG